MSGLSPHSKHKLPYLCMDDSDSSELSDDSILGYVSKKTPPALEQSAPPSSPSLRIPSIFLVEGEKNRKLLQKNEEIQNRIDEDQQRAEEKRESYKRLRLSVLEELNDNGSDYFFTMKNDSAIIEKLVEMTQNSDPTLQMKRQFYFFRNVPQVRFGTKSIDTSLQSLMHRFSPLTHQTKRFTKLAKEKNLDLNEVVLSALESASDPSVLSFFDKWVVDYSQEKDSSTVNEIDCKEFFLVMMKGIGADCETDHLVKKLMLFNNNVEILVYRLRLIYLFCLQCIQSESFTRLLLKNFIFSCSDFHLNKRWKTGLVEVFMIPTFSALIKLFTNTSPTNLALLIHEELAGLKIRGFSEPIDLEERAWELHFTFLNNLFSERDKLDTKAQSILDLLAGYFLELDPSTDLLMTSLSNLLVKFPSSKCSTNVELATKGMYFIKLIMILSTKLVSNWKDHKRLDLYNFQKVLLSTKNSFQQAIGSQELVLVQMTKRQNLTSTLSECYHDLDYLLTVLEKTILLMREDEFYVDG